MRPQTLLNYKGEINKSTIVTEDFHAPISMSDRTHKQRTHSAIEVLKNAVNNLISLTCIDNSIQHQQSMYTSEVHVGHSWKKLHSGPWSLLILKRTSIILCLFLL
jgi:hypothetical protein